MYGGSPELDREEDSGGVEDVVCSEELGREVSLDKRDLETEIVLCCTELWLLDTEGGDEEMEPPLDVFGADSVDCWEVVREAGLVEEDPESTLELELVCTK